VGSTDAVEIRDLATHQELLACVELQRLTWGRDFSDVVPPSILKVSQRLGGVVAGAFGSDGTLLGFVYGITGVERGRIVHWSDMLAVRPELRDRGIGRLLKLYQREAARRNGASVIYWTYDPLVARNAHLNLNRLGARVTEYVEAMYGPESDSELHRGLGTDRFIVAWDAEVPAAERRPGRDAAPRPPDAPVMNAGAEAGQEPAPERFAGQPPPALLVEIPRDIHAVREASAEAASQWRRTTRAAFVWALAHGYVVSGFVREAGEGKAAYVLTHSAPPGAGR
jgi:predicted GNAT superfamily acetyltransferase